MTTRRRGASSGGDGSTTSGIVRVEYAQNKTPFGKSFWTRADMPGMGFLVDPRTNPGAVAYPIDYINWVLRPGPPTSADTRPARTGRSVREIGGQALGGKIGVGYGTTRIAPSVFFGPRKIDASSTQLEIGYALSHGPCSGLLETTFPNGKTIAQLGATWNYGFYPGELYPATHNAAMLLAAGVDHVGGAATFERYPGLCHVGAIATYSEEKWAGITPFPIPLFKFNGRLVRNYQTGLDAFTDNPAYCLADYISSKRYGLGATVNQQSVIDAAAYCNETFTNTGVAIGHADRTLKKHTLNYYLLRAASHKSHIDAMRAHFRCSVIERGKELVFLIDKDEPPVMSFTEDEAVPVTVDRMGGTNTPNQVTVRYPDALKNYEEIPQHAPTAAVEAGIVPIKDAEYDLEGCTKAVWAASEAYYLLNTRLNNLRVVLRAHHPKAMRLQPRNIIEYTSASFGLAGFYLRVLRVTRSADGTAYMIECAGHDPAIYEFKGRAVETYPLPSLPDMHALLPAPTGLGLTETVKEVQAGVYLPLVTVSYTPQVAEVQYGGTKIEYRIAGGAWVPLPVMASGPASILVPDGPGTLVEVRGSTLNRTTGVAGAVGATTSLTTYNPTVEPPGPVYEAPDGGIWWDAPPTRVKHVHSAASWTHSGATLFTAAQVQNGSMATAAFQFNSAGYPTPHWVRVDLGSALLVREVILHFPVASARQSSDLNAMNGILPSGLVVQFSPDNVNWTTAEMPMRDGSGTGEDQAAFVYVPKAGRAIAQVAANTVAQRYMRILHEGAAGTVSFTEAEIFTYTGAPYLYPRGYRVRGWKTNAPSAGDNWSYGDTVIEVDIYDRPTLAAPLLTGFVNSAQFMNTDPVSGFWSFGLGAETFVEVATISPRSVSEFRGMLHRTVGAASSAVGPMGGLEQTMQPIRVFDYAGVGAIHDDFDFDNVSNVLRVTSTNGAAMTLRGLAYGYDGREVIIYNASAAGSLTLSQEALTSVAANRFADIMVIDPGDAITFFYDGVSDRWRSTESTIASYVAILAPKASPALTGVPTAPTAAANTNTTQIATTAYVQTELVDMATDADVALKAPLASPVFTGNPTAPTPLTADNDTSIATTAFVKAQGYTTTVQAAAAAPVQSVAGKVGAVTLAASDVSALIVGGPNGDLVGATVQAQLQELLAEKAPLDSPVFTSVPLAPTAAVGTNTTQLATTAFVGAEIAADIVPLAPKASPALTGVPTAPTAAFNTNTTQLATTAFVLTQAATTAPSMDGVASAGITTAYSRRDHVHPTDTSRAPLASPALTGVPTAPTAAANTNTTQIATTAYVQTELADMAPLASPALTGNPTAPTPATADSDTSIATTAFVKAQGYKVPLQGSVAVNVPNLLTAAEYSFNITVTGAAIGDFAIVSFSSATVAGIMITAEVTSANNVRATLYNNGASGSYDMPAATAYAIVFPRL